MRAKVTLSYDGSRFNGFQSQKETKNTVQETLQSAFLALNIEEKLTASGRTDKGVHAMGQVLHIDLPSFWTDLNRLKFGLNRIISPYIHIKDIKKVDDNFHARYDAKKRVYRYIISTKRVSVFASSYITFVPIKDPYKIKDAIKLFEGEHNFKNFKKTGSDTKNDIRTIYKTDFYKFGDYYIFYFEGNGFLRSQVRMMVAFLLAISDGKLSKDELKLQLQNRSVYLKTLAPPNGLYLARVKY